MLSFFIGLFVGAAVVGSSVSRTLHVEHGNMRGAVFHSVLNSASYFYSIYAIAKGDHIGYAGTALGSTLLMAYMAWKNSKK